LKIRFRKISERVYFRIKLQKCLTGLEELHYLLREFTVLMACTTGDIFTAADSYLRYHSRIQTAEG
jgi:hypothetical protein